MRATSMVLAVPPSVELLLAALPVAPSVEEVEEAEEAEPFDWS